MHSISLRVVIDQNCSCRNISHLTLKSVLIPSDIYPEWNFWVIINFFLKRLFIALEREEGGEKKKKGENHLSVLFQLFIQSLADSYM